MTAPSVLRQPPAGPASLGAQRKQRVPWADLCRVVAIYGVILIHSCGAFFYAYDKAPMSDWLAANALDSMVRVAVPLFVMISGAMLLKPGMPIATPREVLWRVVKVLIPLIFWSAAHLYRNNALGNYGQGLLTIIFRPAMYHLWFVYMIIGLYMIMPFLQMIYEALRTRPAMCAYFFVVWFLIGCVPLYWPLPVLGIMQLGSFLGYGGFFILGGLIAGIPRIFVPHWLCVAIYAVCSASTFYLTWRFSESAGVAVERAYVYFAPNVVIASIAAFLAFSTVELSARSAAVCQWLGDRSFIIYFVHVVILEHVRYSGVIREAMEHLPIFFVILLISLGTFFFSCVAAALIRLIPGASRVAG